jgi:hypothetical protein
LAKSAKKRKEFRTNNFNCLTIAAKQTLKNYISPYYPTESKPTSEGFVNFDFLLFRENVNKSTQLKRISVSQLITTNEKTNKM